MPRQTLVKVKSLTAKNAAAAKRDQAQRTAHARPQTFPDALATGRFPSQIKSWLADAAYHDQSPETIAGKQGVMKWLLWYLEREGHTYCGTDEIKGFLTYLRHGHEDPGGRFGIAKLDKPPSDRMVEFYYIYIKGFFTYMVEDRVLERSPVDRIPRPQNKTAKPISGYTDNQFHTILRLLKDSEYPERELAIAWFLVDTGLRTAEFCSLKCGDIDFEEGICTVIGKGKKHRVFCLGKTNRRMLKAYLMDRPDIGDDEPLFLSSRGNTFGEALSDEGLQSIFKRLNAKTKKLGFHVDVHKFRHTFAMNFLKAGGDIRTLQKLLGHSTLDTTMRYLNITEVDIVNQHRMYSPGDRLAKLQSSAHN